MLVEKGELEEYLTGYQLAYSNRAEKMATERGVNAQIYENNPLEWILATEKIQEEVHDTLEKGKFSNNYREVP